MNNKYDFEDSFISKLEMKRNVGFMPPGAGRGRGGSGSGGGRGGVSGGGRDRGGSRESGQTDPQRQRKPRTIIRYVQAPPAPKPAATTTTKPTPAPKIEPPEGNSRVVEGADGQFYRIRNKKKSRNEESSVDSNQGRQGL